MKKENTKPIVCEHTTGSSHRGLQCLFVCLTSSLRSAPLLKPSTDKRPQVSGEMSSEYDKDGWQSRVSTRGSSLTFKAFLLCSSHEGSHFHSHIHTHPHNRLSPPPSSFKLSPAFLSRSLSLFLFAFFTHVIMFQ